MKYRHQLPQLADRPFITDGGIETTLIFHEGLELPLFAAFDLLKDEEGTAALRRYFEPYAELAHEHGVGLLLESPTWRANPRWAKQIGYDVPALAEMNRKAIALLEELRRRYESDATPVVISGCVGPHDDGYDPRDILGADAARDYHSAQVETFASTAADLVTAITMTYVEEAIGVTRAAVDAGMPVVISFTVETDGRLPSGESLEDAIRRVDDDTAGAPAYYMINCAHPTHFAEAIEGSAVCRERIRGLRANASAKSHAELDEADELDAGDPADLAARHVALRDRLPRLQVLGGCCGTDHRHVGSICSAWLAEAVA